MIRNKLTLSQQIKIEEMLHNDVMDGSMNYDVAHFLATHPNNYREHRESIEDLKRMYP